MALPTITKTWKQLLASGTPGVRITFASILDTTQQYAFRIKDFLCNGSGAATKYTVLWSSSGGTGPTGVNDHTDRITSAASWTPRAAAANASQAWVVLVGGQGEQILLAFQGATDDVMRVAVSPGGLYQLAGITTNQPTANDELLVIGGGTISMVNAATPGDRLLHVWARDDAKGFRVALYRTSALAGPVWFIEEFISGCTPPASVVPVCGGGFLPGNTTVGAVTNTGNVNSGAVSIRTTVATNSFNAVCFIGAEGFGTSNAAASYLAAPEAQGGGFTPYPLSLHSITSGTKGRWGNLIDMWIVSPTGMLPGDGFGTSYQFHQVNALLWPNPANTQPAIL